MPQGPRQLGVEIERQVRIVGGRAERAMLMLM